MFKSLFEIPICYPIIAVMCISLLGVIGCEGDDMQSGQINDSFLEKVSEENWSALAQKKIYFAHQSVGFNIVDGLSEIVERNPEIKLNILKAGESIDGMDSYFAHSQVGKNRDPLSKIKEFSYNIKSVMGEKVDIAFLKFCYVDITKSTDIDNLFNNYKKELSILHKSYPNTKFVHVTTPLKTVQTGIKAVVKNVLGKPAGGYESNVMRNKFNMRLYEEYKGKEPIFDLARIEATRPDGSLEEFSYGDENYISLYPKYTNDGGHLNDIGKKVVAEQLLLLLSDLK